MATPQYKAERLRLRISPRSRFRRHARWSRRAGLSQLYLILSFDCDTAEDIDVVPAVHARLAEIGVTPVYAVPGDFLKRGASVYQEVARSGSEYLNHGGREHTYFDDEAGRYKSNFFYDTLTPETIRADVTEGDQVVREVLGLEPTGFRTPHFGTFQLPEQLRFLHSVLAGLGYRFSTSTAPAYALRYGPAFERFGLLELPVTGTATAPMEILDTWGCFAAPDRTRGPADFLREAESIAHEHSEAGPGLINIYGDPSHIADSEEFFAAVSALARVAKPTGYDQIVEAIA